MSFRGWPKICCACLLLALGGCGRIAQSLYVSGRNRDIQNAAHAIDAARDDVQRARAYSKRGRAYSEKARYCRMTRLIASDEYERLFELAIKDHGQAVALDPGSREAYLDRGQTYYDRATLELQESKEGKRWLSAAAADFEKATQMDAQDYRAFDYLGLAHLQGSEPEKAIEDFKKEMALNPLGKARLADAYCTVGSHYHGQKKYDVASADYWKSIEMGGGGDGCAGGAVHGGDPAV